MLDVIADFWKPVKKIPPQEKLQETQLQIGSSIGFGFVPQALLSGRRLSVSAVNTYQFGIETLTSFVLSQDRDPSVSMIIAESEGEQYLAISRRVPLEERLKLFDTFELENILAKPDATRLYCKDNVAEFKSWLVGSYKREIQGLKGRIYKGDYRKLPLPATSEGQEFEYTLLVSDSNEHAIEIEKYTDGRLEVYATIYRRINDVGEISHPASELVLRPEIKLATKRDDVVPTAAAPAAPSPVLLEPVQVLKPAEKPAAPAATLSTNDVTAEVKAELKAETKQAAPVATQPVAPATPVAAAPINMTGAQFGVVSSAMPLSAPVTPVVQQSAAPAVMSTSPVNTPSSASSAVVVPRVEVKPEVKAESKIEVKPEPKAEAKPAEIKVQAVATSVVAAAPASEPKVETKPAVAAPVVAAAPTAPKEKTTMPSPELAAVNGVHADAAKPTLYVHNNAPDASSQQSVKAVSRPLSQFENDSIECDLRVANKLIDEAIRNEMRLNDVVRRVIELPVANPESVQIPVTLTDEDYSLLAIRYSIPASDRNAIKRRIIEDLNDFSGEKKA
jgi:DedD protein